MQQGKVVFRFLLPADQNSPEAVHPAMRSLRHPTSCFETSSLLDFLCFFSACEDVSGEAEFLQQRSHLVVIVSFIHAHALRLLACRSRSTDRNALDRLANQPHVMPIGAVDRQSDRNAHGFAQQRALDPVFASIRRVGAGFFPLPTGLWSSPRPCSATTNPAPSVRRTPSAQLSRAAKRRQPSPILESGREPSNRDRFPWHPTPATGNLCVTRRKSRPCTPGPVCTACRHRIDVCFCAWEPMAPSCTKVHRGSKTMKSSVTFQSHSLHARAPTPISISAHQGLFG